MTKKNLPVWIEEPHTTRYTRPQRSATRARIERVKMETYKATEVKVSDIRVGDLVNNVDGNNWVISGIDIDNDNGFIRYIIGFSNTSTNEEWVNDFLPNDVVTYRHKTGDVAFAVRLFINDRWHIIRSYGDFGSAQEFAKNLTTEWDIKAMTLDEIIHAEKSNA